MLGDSGISRRALVKAGILGCAALLGCGCAGTHRAGGSAPASGSVSDAGASPAFRDTRIGCDLGAPDPVALEHARRFTIDTYAGDERLVCMESGERYLILPAGATVPRGLAADIAVIEQPLDKVYLVSTGMICLLDELDALDAVRVASVTPDTSPNEELARRIEAGEVVFGGRYRDPDFELIAAEGCPVAIENTQIMRYPDIKRKLEELGVAVLTELSSTEDTVLGRLEWIRLMGVLFDRDDRARSFFDEAVARVDAVAGRGGSGARAVFFYLDENGAPVVRRAGDYFQQMIELAGGACVSFERDPDADASSTTYITVEWESFLAAAQDADVIIYNATVDEGVASIDDLVRRNRLLADFTAVRDGEVYTCDATLYQQMTATPDIIEELSRALSGKLGAGRFIRKLG